MKLIDKSAVVAEIEKKLQDIIACKKDAFYPEERVTLRAKINMCKEILSFLDTLEVKEVDLEEELDSWRHSHFHGRRDKEASGEYLKRVSQLDLAKHFFELGIKSKSSYVGIPNIDDTLKEMGVDPDSKSAKSFKEFYYMALEKFKAQKGE